MTPAINYAKRQRLSFQTLEYEHDSTAPSFGAEAAEKLNLNKPQVFKTLIVELNTNAFVTALVPVNKMLDLKAVAKTMGVKKAQMADPKRAEQLTGYVLGGVSPFGQKKRLPVVIDRSANSFNDIYVSGGRRGLELCVCVQDLLATLNALQADIAY